MADKEPSERPRVTRKQALMGAGALAVAGGGAAIAITSGDDDDSVAKGGYPRRTVARAGDLRPNQPVNFEYPAKGQLSVLVDLGQEVPGGVGDQKSIVAYSSLCQHMGCPVGYVPEKRHFHCGCHQTQYDPAREGVVIEGVSHRPLPRIALEVDGEDIVATGVNGLIYGYRANLTSAATSG